ncbi:T9SS type B sorting domain-containing protein [Lacinutrix jangbogonensis]|uniref:T9SS type B sorting domain-containing protein n=1 Tax=Lacinutrix jangbogonensis TaxID=1469557 RepID=UPI00053E1F34|nr:T9SS type B sorting domain-containing protein [Lacinutrix jangbogonensis]
MAKYSKILMLFIAIVFSSLAIAQQQAANWYFGNNAGINFDVANNTVSSLDNGELITAEGCTSISDENGNLVLYTDGTTIYNAAHAVMENGNNLLGDESSTQSAITIPKPNDPNIYYVFTVGSNSNSTGLNYYTVDLAFNGGLGKVIGSNTNLLGKCAEKISAVLKDCLTGNIWVIAFSNDAGTNATNMDTFHAFEVSTAGVNTAAVKSTLALSISDFSGNLKFSPNSSKLASANGTGGLFIADFDASTGTVSNPEFLETQSPVELSYGVEFSPNSQLLYVTTYLSQENPTDPNGPPLNFSNLYQYNAFATDITASRTLITNQQLYRSSLQLGPNGKIYCSLSETYNEGIPFLSTINNPNTIGMACNYQHKSVNLSGNVSRQGLPPFIQSFFTQQIDIIQNGSDTLDLILCTNDIYTLTAEIIPGAIYTWSKDGNPLTEVSNELTINTPGNYQVLIETNTNCGDQNGQANVTYTAGPQAFDASLFQCGTSDFSTFNLNQADEELTGDVAGLSTQFFFSQMDAINGTGPLNGTSYINISNPQDIYVRVIDDNTTCFNISVLSIGISTSQVTNYIAPEVCDETESPDGINTFNLDDYSPLILTGLPPGFGISYYSTYNDALLEQNVLLSNYNNVIPYSETIYSRIENGNICYGINEILLTINPLPLLGEDETILYCINNSSLSLVLESGLQDSNTSNYTFNWSTGESTQTISINTIGVFTVTVTNNSTNCANTRTFNIEASNIATIDEIIINDGQLQNNSITVLTSGEGEYEYALEDYEGITTPFQTLNTFTNLRPGVYNIIIRDIKNDCGTIEAVVSIIGFPLYFTPNGDGEHDTWHFYGANSRFQSNVTVFIYNRYGKLITQLKPNGPGWDGTLNGKPLPQSDYWFYVTLDDGREFKSHFTLKR